MLGIDGGIRVDLQRVYVVARVLKEAVVRVQHLVGEQVEPFPSDAAVVEPFLTLEFDHEPFAQVFGSHLHDLSVRLFEDLLATHFQPAMSAVRLERLQLGSQGTQFLD